MELKPQSKQAKTNIYKNNTLIIEKCNSILKKQLQYHGQTKVNSPLTTNYHNEVLSSYSNVNFLLIKYKS